MKLLSVPFLLILLTCAYLLVVVNVCVVTNESDLNQAEQKDNPDNDKTKTEIRRPPTSQIETSTDTAQGKQSASNPLNFFCGNQIPNWLSILGWIIAAGVACWSLAAIYRQADIADRGVKVAHAAAIAAKESAELANKALHTDRPYLLIEDIKLTGINMPSELGIVAAWIAVTNYGRGPAFIDEAIGAIRIVNGELPARDYSGCIELGVQSVIRPGESLPDSLMATLKVFSDTDREQFLAGNERKNLVVYGKIAYRDLMDGKYIEGFYWHADAFSTRIRMSLNSWAEPAMKRGPKTHNYHESATNPS